MNISEIQDGSIRQLWKVSSALMISFLSMVVMMFADRFFLSYYSAEALSAATSAGTLFWAGNFMCVSFVAMAEIFVAQYNGSKQYHKLGEPVWQMIWFALGAFVFFFALGSFGTNILMKVGYMNGNEGEYFRWNNYFAPWFTLLTALSAFYIGQGKTRVIKWLGVLGNGINIILDPLFIFGYKGIIPKMGIQGAAIATGIGIIVQVLILSCMFLHKKNQITFGTKDFRFKKGPFMSCLKVAISPALFVMLELLGWALFYKMMEQISPKHILVASVAQTILILFLFFGLGLEKGVGAIAGNLIGAGRLGELKRLLRSGLTLCLLFGIAVTIILGSFSDAFINLFFKNPDALSGSTIAISAKLLAEIKIALKFAMVILIFYMIIENIRWLFSGLLTAAGDTFLPMVLGVISIWAFLLLPTYFLVFLPKAPIEKALYIWILFSVGSTLLFILRFMQGKWKTKQIISKDQGETCPLPSQDSSREVSH